MWQVFQQDLQDLGVEIVAVALDAGGREAVEAKVRPTDLDQRPDVVRRLRGWGTELWDAKAPPRFTCLIDAEHRLADLYGMVNVPTAVWIDEEGRIVRPAEPAGATDHFRSMDPDTFAIPDSDAAALEGNRSTYVAALFDWARNGSESRFALPPDEVVARLRRPAEADARAAVHARIGRHLHTAGDAEGAKDHFGRALELVPEKWTFRRQAMVLDPELIGALNVSEGYYEAIDALGEDQFYPPIDMPGIDSRPEWLDRRPAA